MCGLETPCALGVRGLGTTLDLGVEGGEKDLVGRCGEVCEERGEVMLVLCVAVAVVSLSARANPASVRENLKL